MWDLCEFPPSFNAEMLFKCQHRISHISCFFPVTGFGGGFSTCKGVDLDPRNECKPVDCLEKYNGFRSFFDKERGKCIPVHDCYTKMEDNKDVPEIVSKYY